MANPRYNKQVAQPRAAHKVGGRVKKWVAECLQEEQI